MTKILWGGVSLFVVVGFLIGILAACEEPAPAEPTGIELDIDRAKPRPPLKAPKPAKGAKR